MASNLLHLPTSGSKFQLGLLLPQGGGLCRPHGVLRGRFGGRRGIFGGATREQDGANALCSRAKSKSCLRRRWRTIEMRWVFRRKEAARQELLKGAAKWRSRYFWAWLKAYSL